ncbi:hypothetical protein FF80_01043 [Devosia sp. LC5]|nr:hypothetical protein FF80_01043 [Devosia sp. LC5]
MLVSFPTTLGRPTTFQLTEIPAEYPNTITMGIPSLRKSVRT